MSDKILRDYQVDMISKIKTDMTNNVKNIVMAMCPNAGKTFTTIKLLEDLIETKKVSKVLILAHGTTVLRDQFYSAIIENSPSFTVSTITQDKKDTSGQVVIAIPQGLQDIDLTQFDFLVVDEAHERFLAKEGKLITNKVNAKHNLLLTGTPSRFIYENIKSSKYSIHLVAMSDIPSDFMANSQLFICSSKYTFKDEDYNSNEELNSSVKITREQTENSLDELVEQMVKILKMKSITNLDNFYPLAFNKLQKTMIVCRRQSQAKQVYNHLNRKGINSTISTEDVDKDSNNIQNFIKDDTLKVLIVVGRGILGFNLPTLVNIVDMSGTRNLDRMYQMFSRITRTHKDYPVKRYFKLAPVGEVEYTQYVASAMLSLIHRDNMKMYNGKNFKVDLPILVKKETKETNEEGKDSEKSGSKKSSQSIMEFEGLDVIVEFTRMYSNMDKTLQVYSRINLQEAMVALDKYSKQLPKGWWDNKDRVIKASKCYKSIIDFVKGNVSVYNAANRNGWMQEIVDLNNWEVRTSNGHWNIKANVIEASKCCESLRDFAKGNSSAYNAALKNGWMQELVELNDWEDKTRHKKKVQCIETGKTFESQSEASKEMGLFIGTISLVCKGKRKQTGGYTFKYVEEDE